MLNLPRFLKRFIRKHSRPKIPETALQKRSKLSLLYAVITWNLLGLVVYSILKKDRETPSSEKVSEGRYFANKLGIDNAKLIRISGFSKVGEWDLVEEKKKHGKFLTDLELEALEKGEQLVEKQEEEQQQQDYINDSEDINAEKPFK